MKSWFTKESVHRFLKGISLGNLGPFDPVIGGIDGHDCMMIVGHQYEAIVAMIVQRACHNRATIVPRSRNDRFTIAR